MPILDKAKIKAQVQAWNDAHAIGTRVQVKGRSEAKVTRTAAMMLFDQKAVIYLEGHNGYFDLDDVLPADQAAHAQASPPPPTATPTPAPTPAAPAPVVARRSAPAVQTGVACMFPGQGSQKSGMGADLFDAFPEQTRIADRVLGYSIKELCLSDTSGRLDRTQFTQPALFVVNALSWLSERAKESAVPAFVLGHSLGEYNALFAAGVFDFETGLKLVQKRGALMAEAKAGGMAAVIGLSAERVQEVLDEGGLGTLDLANLNSGTQVVISGPPDDLTRAEPVFEKAGSKMYIRLKVSGAFHSRYMKESADAFATFMRNFQYAEPAIPVISNVEAKPYDAHRIPELLTGQLTSPVRWADSVNYLVTQKVETFREVGPGAVLTGLVRKVRSGT